MILKQLLEIWNFFSGAQEKKKKKTKRERERDLQLPVKKSKTPNILLDFCFFLDIVFGAEIILETMTRIICI